MTNFERYAETPEALSELLYAVIEDALSARGCAMRLKLPPEESPDWLRWLESPYVNGLPPAPLFPEPPPNMTPEQHNAKFVTDKLQDVLDIMKSNRTPFAQILRDILNKAMNEINSAVGEN